MAFRYLPDTAQFNRCCLGRWLVTNQTESGATGDLPIAIEVSLETTVLGKIVRWFPLSVLAQ